MMDSSFFINAFLSSVTRALSPTIGKQFDGNRDLNKSLGYLENPSFQDFYNRYKRQDIAGVVVEAFPDECWRLIPTIRDLTNEENKESTFEKQIEALLKNNFLRIFYNLRRADILCGINNYSVIYLGFLENENIDISTPIQNPQALSYLRVFTDNEAQINSYVDDVKNPLYGMPQAYNIKFGIGEKAISKVVHASRCLHIVEDPIEDLCRGTSRIYGVIDRLFDLEKVVGGSAESYWQLAFPGFNLKLDPETTMTPEDSTAAGEQLERFFNDYRQRYLKLKGVTVERLNGTPVSPKEMFDVIISLIAAKTRIPKRKLIGSERGELASSQDDKNFLQDVDSRRTNFCEAVILRPFIGKLQQLGLLDQVEFEIDWPDLFTKSDGELSATAKTWSETFKNYKDSQLDQIMPFNIFLSRICGFSKSEVDEVIEKLTFEMEENIKQEEAEAEDAEAEDKMMAMNRFNFDYKRFLY